MNRDDVVSVLERAILDFQEAKRALWSPQQDWLPTRVSPPRWKRMVVLSARETEVGVCLCLSGDADDAIVIRDGKPHPSAGSARSLARQIAYLAGWRSRVVLRALRRIQAATAWCRARREGVLRAYSHNARHSRAVKALEAEAALSRLAGGG